jgi:hypothetical protein
VALWGVGQRIFFLHDGRTTDLLEAIKAHRSHRSGANAMIDAFNHLRVSDKQAILDFLRSLLIADEEPLGCLKRGAPRLNGNTDGNRAPMPTACRLLICWCGRRDSNPHDVAIEGF